MGLMHVVVLWLVVWQVGGGDRLQGQQMWMGGIWEEFSEIDDTDRMWA